MTRREHQPSRFSMWICVAAALGLLALMGAGAPNAEAKSRFVELRAPGGGSSARIEFWQYRRTNLIQFRGRVWDKRGDGMHARVFVDDVWKAYSTRGRALDFGYRRRPMFSPYPAAEHSFMVCTFNRDEREGCRVTRRSTK